MIRALLASFLRRAEPVNHGRELNRIRIARERAHILATAAAMRERLGLPPFTTEKR